MGTLWLSGSSAAEVRVSAYFLLHNCATFSGGGDGRWEVDGGGILISKSLKYPILHLPSYAPRFTGFWFLSLLFTLSFSYFGTFGQRLLILHCDNHRDNGTMHNVQIG